MSPSLKQQLLQHLRDFTTVRKTEKKWHTALVGTFCLGAPLFFGYFIGNMTLGLLAALGGLSSLYLKHDQPIPTRMMSLLVCIFGFLVAFTIGISFSFNPLVSSIAFGIFSAIIHAVVLLFRAKPPGSFFFILIAAMASSIPFDLSTAPAKIGLVALGGMSTALIALLYSCVVERKRTSPKSDVIEATLHIDRNARFTPALIMGVFMFITMGLGNLLKLQNTYWVPISCAAIMQSASLSHTWQRCFQRIVGTFLGMGLCWLLILGGLSPLKICLYIMALQFILENIIPRHYGLAVIFITPLTILLTAAKLDIADPSAFMAIRFINITLGSFLGILGGVLLHQKRET